MSYKYERYDTDEDSPQDVDPGVMFEGYVDGSGDDDWYNLDFEEDGVGTLFFTPNGNHRYKITVWSDNQRLFYKTTSTGESLIKRFPVERSKSYQLCVEFKGTYSKNITYEFIYNNTDYVEEIDEEHDATSTAQNLAVGTTVKGYSDYYGTRRSYYRFISDQDADVELSVTLAEFFSVVDCWILDGDLNTIYDGEISGGQLAFRRTISCKAGEVFYVRISMRAINREDPTAYTVSTQIEGIGGPDLTGGAPKSKYTIDGLISDVRTLESAVGKYFEVPIDTETINKQVGLLIAALGGYDEEWDYVLAGGLLTGYKNYVIENHQDIVTRIENARGRTFNFEGVFLDVPHLIATMLGYIYPSIAGKAIPSNFFGWGGDLGSGARYIQSRVSADAELEEAKAQATLSIESSASIEDMVTDIDGELLAAMYDTKNPILFSELLRNYYRRTQNSRNRFKTFYGNYGGDEYAVEENFKDQLVKPLNNITTLALSKVTKLKFEVGYANGFMCLNAMCWRFAQFLKYLNQ